MPPRKISCLTSCCSFSLRKSFAKAQEHFELAFHFANWDFETWFNSFHFDHDTAFEPSKNKLVDPNFGAYSFDLVFRYEYVGEELWQHGGIKVCLTCMSTVCH